MIIGANKLTKKKCFGPGNKLKTRWITEHHDKWHQVFSLFGLLLTSFFSIAAPIAHDRIYLFITPQKNQKTATAPKDW